VFNANIYNHHQQHMYNSSNMMLGCNKNMMLGCNNMIDYEHISIEELLLLDLLYHKPQFITHPHYIHHTH